MSGRPLQIVTLPGEDQVALDQNNLKVLDRILTDVDATHVSFLAVMGKYRTGKSFILNFLLRNLRAMEISQMEDQHNNPLRGEGESVEKLPPWIYEGDAKTLSDGKVGCEERGFGWRGGEDRCTEGIWVYSKPFIFQKDGKRIALFVMDTQGAYDEQTTQYQSSTIFGLTALLASSLIYNISKQIDASSINDLDYFLECAVAACRSLEVQDDKQRLFGDLFFLIRDWPHYKDARNLEQCRGIMQEHQKKHLSKDRVPKTRHGQMDRIAGAFANINCHGLVHPGLHVEREDWDADIHGINPDFFYLLDDFTASLFGGSFPEPAAPLGMEITPKTFVPMIEQFIKAFDSVKGMEMGLREAFVTVQVLMAREGMLKSFKVKVEQDLPHNKVWDPKELQEKLEKIKDQMLHDFQERTLGGFRLSIEEQQEHSERLKEEFDKFVEQRLHQNQATMQMVHAKLIATPAVGLGGMIVLSHHWVAYIGAPVYVAWRAKKNKDLITEGRTTDEGAASYIESEVWVNTGKDMKSLGIACHKDLHDMRIALQTLKPEHVQKAVADVAKPMAAGAVIVASDKLSSSGK